MVIVRFIYVIHVHKTMSTRFVGCRLDEETFVKMTRKCGGMECTPSEYIRNLIKEDTKEIPQKMVIKL